MKNNDYEILGYLWALWGQISNLHYLALTKGKKMWGEHLRFDAMRDRNDGIIDWVDSFQETVIIPMTKNFQSWQMSARKALELMPEEPKTEEQGVKDLRKLILDALDLIDTELKEQTTGSQNLYCTTAQYLQQMLGWLGTNTEEA